jgi:Fe-S-cluster-containing hydrogenase component 2
MRHIVLNTETCAGCSTCGTVCSLYHEGAVSPSLARLRITDHYVEGHRIEGYVCKQCTAPECLHACRTKATGALHLDKKTGAKIIDPAICNGCKLCIEACPLHPNSPIYYHAEKKICFKCDLCGGEPLCVKFCPEAALTFPEA